MPTSIPIVIVESPYAATDAGHQHLHIEYARACVRDSFKRGEAPFASHLLYTQADILDDDKPEEREHGISCGHLFLQRAADYIAVYIDMGISLGMNRGIHKAKECGRVVEYRSLWHKVDPNTGNLIGGV
jgi:hypothetical protein